MTQFIEVHGKAINLRNPQLCKLKLTSRQVNFMSMVASFSISLQICTQRLDGQPKAPRQDDFSNNLIIYDNLFRVHIGFESHPQIQSFGQ
jgi:hypothetical protein